MGTRPCLNDDASSAACLVAHEDCLAVHSVAHTRGRGGRRGLVAGYSSHGNKRASTRLAANRGSPTVAQAMRPRRGKANEEEKGMTEPPKKRPMVDPSRVRPASQEDQDRIYGSQGLSIYSPVRQRRCLVDEHEASVQSSKRKTAYEGTHE